MELTAINSKNVAAVGYLGDPFRVLLVAYKDGSLYARLEVDEAEYAALMAADSKGGYLSRMEGPILAIKRAGPAKAAAPATLENSPTEPAAVVSEGRPVPTAAAITADAMRAIQQAVAPTSAADCAFTVLR